MREGGAEMEDRTGKSMSEGTGGLKWESHAARLAEQSVLGNCALRKGINTFPEP